LPQPDGPISAVIGVLWMFNEDVLTAGALPVVDREILDVEDDVAADVRGVGGAATPMARGGLLLVSLGSMVVTDGFFPAPLSLGVHTM